MTSSIFTVYVLYNPEYRKTYVGQTSSLEHRLIQHRNGLSTWTARFPGEWTLIHQESFDTRPDAMKRERQLKSGGGRRFIQTLVDGINGESNTCK